MILFIKRTLLYGFSLLLLSIFIIETVRYIASENINFELDEEILILGDSQTQYAFNDSLIPGAINLSESADTYFFSYIKLKKIVNVNPNINTLILGYSYHNISQQQDQWLVSEKLNSYKFPLYFSLIDKKEMKNFINYTGVNFLSDYYYKTFFPNLKLFFRTLKSNNIRNIGIGGYAKTDENNPKKRKKDLKKINLGVKDLKNLDKIINFCKDKEITVILVTCPIYEKEKTLNNITFSIKDLTKKIDKYKDDVKYLNFENFSIPKSGFKDEIHLNSKGAIFFTQEFNKYLKDDI